MYNVKNCEFKKRDKIMTEIELKAHVFDRAKLIQTLKEFAVYEQTVFKDDTYYHLATEKTQQNGKNYISVRIRKETKKTENGNETTNYLTYKKKELITGKDGPSTEVNDEKETKISNPESVETLLKDIGFTPAQKKQKEVTAYVTQTVSGKATLELCNIHKLGDFLEIEILSEKNDAETIQKIQRELKNLLFKCGIPEKDIEKRYYNEMLEQLAD